MMDFTAISLPEFCKQQRKRRDWSQTELGDKCGMTLFRIHNLEATGAKITLEDGLRLIRALGYDVWLDGDRLSPEVAGESAKTRRYYLDLSQDDVAKKAGVSKSTVRKMENAKPVMFENAQFILQALDLIPTMVEIDRPKRSGGLSKLCRQIRREEGMTQKQLASKSYVCWQTVQQFEQGNVYPRIDTVEAIFKGLGYQLVVEEVPDERLSQKATGS